MIRPVEKRARLFQDRLSPEFTSFRGVGGGTYRV